MVVKVENSNQFIRKS